jgi:hypothetical protein
MLKTIVVRNTAGGISKDQKDGQFGSARFVEGLNIHEDANYITLQPKPGQVGGGVVESLVKWMDDASPWNSLRYAYDAGGNIYSVDVSDETWTKIRTVPDSTGQGAIIYDDYYFYAGSKTFGRYGRLSATPTFEDDFLVDNETNEAAGEEVSVANSYTTPTAISETEANKRYFTPTVDPVGRIWIDILTKGTGDITLTVHDFADRLVATKTLLNSEFSTGYTQFNFDLQARVTPNERYHFHVTSTVADTVVVVNTTNDLRTAEYVAYWDALVDDNSYHPMAQFQDFIVVGNERYLAVWNGFAWSPNKISFPPGMKVRAITKVNEYVAVLCYTGSITQSDKSMIFFWDGISSTYNYFKDLPRGVGHTITNYREQLVSLLGTRALLHMGAEPFVPIQELPGLGRGKYLDIAPSGLSTWQNKIVIAAASITDDEDFIQGVYMYGNETDGEPKALTLAFTPSSLATTGTDVKVLGVFPFGDTLYFSWANDTSFGVDKILTTNEACVSGEWDSLIYDSSNATKEKLAVRVVVECEPLPEGCTLTAKCKLNRGTWQTGHTATQGATRAVLNMDKRYREAEFGFDVSSEGEYPIITSVTFTYDPKSSEVQDR